MTVEIRIGDCRQLLAAMPDESVHCVVTSPPYFSLRDYGVDGQIGLEATPDEFTEIMVEVFCEVRRVLRNDGTLWLNLGDSYAGQHVQYEGKEKKWQHGVSKTRQSLPALGAAAGIKAKNLIGIPWRVAFALQADGWYLRQDIIWSKPNPMPESVTDRCTKAHEYMFLLSKSARYWYDADAIAEDAARAGDTPGGGTGYVWHGTGGHNKDGLKANGQKPVADTRNRRSVWTFATQPFSEAHFATFPPDLIEPCIKAGCPKGGTVLDPFGGAGTTGLVADRLGRNAILLELNPTYAEMARRRIEGDCPMFAQVAAQ